MHVLYHHRTSGDGVEGVHIMGVVRALRELGHSVDIAGPPGCSPERRSPAPAQAAGLRGRLKRFARHAPPLLFELGELAYNACALLQMLKLAHRRRPDLIYERTTSNSVAPTVVAAMVGVPIVQEVNVTAEVGRFRPLVLRKLTAALERWVARRASLAITVSETFKRMIVEAGWPAGRILVCPNAIDPGRFCPESVTPARRPPNVGREAPVVGYVGSFLPYHRLDMLVGIARELAPAHPGARWLLVGDGVERPRIEALLRESGLADRFWLAGNVPHDSVPSYLAAMDVALLPSSGTFNSPMKLFEYMAMARAVLAPRVPAIEEVIEDGEQGLLFEPGDAAACRDAVNRLLAGPDLRVRLGRNARQAVLAKHTWTRNAQRLLAATARLQRPLRKASKQ